MRRSIAIILLVLMLVPFNLSAADQLAGYVPYEEDEFPLWSYKIRRAETLFFGSLVLTLPVAVLLYNVAQNTNLISPASSELQGFLIQGSIAAGISLGISFADYLIGELGER
ncbi:MAG: hypothetical protein ACQ5SW_08735 [Sphaerochaetaceae bacterium]